MNICIVKARVIRIDHDSGRDHVHGVIQQVRAATHTVTFLQDDGGEFSVRVPAHTARVIEDNMHELYTLTVSG